MLPNQTISNQQDQGVINYAIQINGEPIPTVIGLYELSVCKEVNRIPTAKITIIDGEVARQDFEISNQEWFIPGNEVSIYLGYLNSERLIFKGSIITHEITISQEYSFLEISCRDIAYQMTLIRGGRYFDNLTDSELIKSLLSDYFEESAYEVAPTTYTHREVVQYDCSDWDLMVSRAESNGLLIIVDDGNIQVKAPDFEQPASMELIYGLNIIEFDGKIESRDQFGQVVGRAWNPDIQAVEEVVAAQADIVEHGDLPGNIMASNQNAISTVYRHGGAIRDVELQAWANARMLKDRLSRTCGRVQFEGYNQVKPGQIVLLEGLGNRFNGPVYVTSVRQEYMDEGWLTEIEFGLSPKWFAQIIKQEAPPAAGMLASVCGLQTGIVTQINSDPYGQHRVRVRMPVLDHEAEGVWARIATLDAGLGRGSYFLPEVGDEVILGFINDDPRHPVILGMMHSRLHEPPFRASEENDEKGFVSREQLKIVFDEKERSIRLETPKGSMLKISDEYDENKALVLEDQYGNSIQMGKNGIRLNSIKDFEVEAPNNIILNSSKAIECKTKGSMRLTASSLTEIKGKPVNIN